MSSVAEYKAERKRYLARFGEQVRHLRTTNTGLSQERLSEAARLHRTEISRIELGLVEPRLLTLVVLAEGLDVRLDDLVTGLWIPAERKPSPEPRYQR